MPNLRVMTHVLPLLLCIFCTASWADTLTEIEELIQNKQWALAQQRIDAASKPNTKAAESPQWRLLNSQVLSGQGKAQEAIDLLQSLIQEFPELPEPYNNLGVILAAQGQFDAAANALKSAVQARPNYKIALKNLGDLYTAMAQQAYAQAQNVNTGPARLPLPAPAVATTTTTNTRALR